MTGPFCALVEKGYAYMTLGLALPKDTINIDPVDEGKGSGQQNGAPGGPRRQEPEEDTGRESKGDSDREQEGDVIKQEESAAIEEEENMTGEQDKSTAREEENIVPGKEETEDRREGELPNEGVEERAGGDAGRTTHTEEQHSSQSQDTEAHHFPGGTWLFLVRAQL
ncbi:hypothetical protein NDU88_002417 [Pleurodeles waltl]|uniref:Uncharacterized protein n=1 Tax=Pleurodeles waltl TaxID=8319 RepID=A0AAV7MPK8_PLEWA|nr:hypothetical protein NDU88_002417 [Pleurodeles waltl]